MKTRRDILILFFLLVIFCNRGLTNAYKMLALHQTFHLVRFFETAEVTLIMEGWLGQIGSDGIMTQLQQLVSPPMVQLSSMGFIRKLLCWLQNAVLLRVIYIHYFGGFRWFVPQYSSESLPSLYWLVVFHSICICAYLEDFSLSLTRVYVCMY